MARIKLPPKWTHSEKQIRTTQMSFEFDQLIERDLKQEALDNNHSPSTQLRLILGLPVGTPVRRRVSVSLSPEDKAILAKLYNIDLQDSDLMRAMISKKITDYFAKEDKPAKDDKEEE
jgi:hypothetical protein